MKDRLFEKALERYYKIPGNKELNINIDEIQTIILENTQIYSEEVTVTEFKIDDNCFLVDHIKIKSDIFKQLEGAQIQEITYYYNAIKLLSRVSDNVLEQYIMEYMLNLMLDEMKMQKYGQTLFFQPGTMGIHLEELKLFIEIFKKHNINIPTLQNGMLYYPKSTIGFALTKVNHKELLNHICPCSYCQYNGNNCELCFVKNESR